MATKAKPHPFDVVLKKRFGGVLLSGKHSEDGQACALEAASAARKKAWSDEPDQAGLPDLRPVNDGLWSSDAARTAALAPVVRALWGWPDWSEERRVELIQRVVLRNIREVLPVALEAIGLADCAEECRKAADLADAARAAADAARAAYAAADAAADAAHAAYAAYAAARAAARAADDVLSLACRIWVEEAERNG